MIRALPLVLLVVLVVALARWVSLRPELVVEVTFDHVSNDRIRHGTKISRWREDKPPAECGMDQLSG